MLCRSLRYVSPTCDPVRLQVEGPWINFPGDDVCMDFRYNKQKLMPVPQDIVNQEHPDKVRFHSGGQTYTYNVEVVEEITELDDLFSLWCPDHNTMPSLPHTFNEVWKEKVELLKAMASCISRSPPYLVRRDRPAWNMNRKKVWELVPTTKVNITVEELAAAMERALMAGMSNGRAKAFLLALGAFLLDDTEECKLMLYHDQAMTITENSDDIYGRVRYLGTIAFDSDIPLQCVQKRKGRKRRLESDSDAGSDVDSGSASDVSTSVSMTSKSPDNLDEAPAKVYTLSPDCVLYFRDYWFITCVFECTEQVDPENLMHSCLQNVHQMLSLIRDQRAILGCTVYPDGFIFRLAVRQGDTIRIYGSHDFSFSSSGAVSFNTKELLKLSEFLLKIMYFNLGRLSKAYGLSAIHPNLG